MDPLISIIIPVYNAAEYLEKCLDSLAGQTYSTLQFVCVDDASTDSSLGILKAYAESDPRFCVYQKKNDGVSEARNFALDHACGEYIMFVDSDDWIDTYTCEKALKAAQDYQADVVMWSYVREMSGDSRPKAIMSQDRVYDKNAVQNELHRRMIGITGEELTHPENADALCTVWGKLYRREIIEQNQIRFFDIRKIGTYEDGLFNLDVFHHAKRVVFLNQYWYHYRRDNAASITNAHKPQLNEKRQTLFSYMDSYIKENALGTEYVQARNNRIVLSLIDLGINAMGLPTAKGRIHGIREIIYTEQYRNAIKSFNAAYLPVHWKLFFKLAKLQSAVGVYLLLCAIQKIRGR